MKRKVQNNDIKLLKLTFINSALKGEKYKKTGQEMISIDFVENKWSYMKYTGTFLCAERLWSTYIYDWNISLNVVKTFLL